MSTLFYLGGMIILIICILVLGEYKKFDFMRMSMTRVKHDQYTKSQKKYSVYSSLSFFWYFFGLLTDQWVAFVAYILIIQIGYRVFKFGKFYPTRLFVHLFTILFLVFVLINHYHMRIDLFGYIQYEWFGNHEYADYANRYKNE